MVSSPVLVWKRWPDTPTMSPTSSFFAASIYKPLQAKFLAAGVALDAAALVHDVEEGHLAEGTQRDDAAGDGEHVPLGFQFFGAQAAEIVQHPADGMFLAEIIGEQRHTGVQQVTGFDDAVFDDFVEHVALGKALKHGHEIGGVLRLGIQLDLLLLRTLFPVFLQAPASGHGPALFQAQRLNG